MKLSELEAGTKLEIEIINEDGVRKGPVFVSKFELGKGDFEAIIAAPIHEGKIYPIPTNSRFYVYFLQKKEGTIIPHRFMARVVNRLVYDNLRYLAIEQCGKIERIQRRKYFRLDCPVQVYYREVNSLIKEQNADIPYKNTISNNLSGGGISLKLNHTMKVGSLVECDIFADTGKKVSFFGKVVRFEAEENLKTHKYNAGIAYIRINEADREEVIRYIFREQRRLRRKGLI